LYESYHQQRKQQAEEKSEGEGIPADEESRQDVVSEDAGAVVTRKTDKS